MKMYKFILAGTALMIAPALSAQVHRNVQRSTTTTVHRSGNATVHKSTTVNRNVNVNVNRTYHPGNWNRARVRAGVYHHPHGYAYRRWTVGRVLPRAYWSPTYYYRGYAALGLMAPPANFQWVRYGPDLLLVNIRTGNVVDIRYGVFG